jgi:MoxR-like ATPase
VRQVSSVRGAIDCVLVALQLALLRHLRSPDDEGYPELVYDAMTVSLSGRIHLDEAAGSTPERVLREIWEDRFVLDPAIAEPG